MNITPDRKWLMRLLKDLTKLQQNIIDNFTDEISNGNVSFKDEISNLKDVIMKRLQKEN